MELRKKFKASAKSEEKCIKGTRIDIRHTSMKTIVTLFAAFVFLTVQAQASARDQQSVGKCLPQIESVLGKPATDKAPVYELSAVHAIELEFDKDCQIVFVQIGPKYFWEQKLPEWVEPRSAPKLSMSEYEGFLSRINQLRNTGSVVRKGDSGISIVTNSKHHTWDEYEHTFINRVMHCCDNRSVFAVYIYFLRNIQGKVEKIRSHSEFDNVPRRVMIKKQWYLIPSNQKVSLGTRAQLRAVGPMRQFF